MKNSSEKKQTLALFILGTFGLRFFSQIHTLLLAIPNSLFCDISVLILAIYFIYIVKVE